MTAKANFTVKLPDSDFKRLLGYLREAGTKAGLAENAIDDMMDEASTGSKKAGRDINELNTKMDKFAKAGSNAIKAISFAYLVDQALDLQGRIVDITAEFEKMEAVLTTALGSRSAAQVAMAQIQNFAARTPYQVSQLTDSYVKLVNRGLQPANKELTAMGDFAAASGKDFEQLVEAILDVNNTERWTELGLKVKTEGDRISGTFKGITIEADRTEAGAMRMIKAFGEMEGVAGSMEGISTTLSGKLSNLDDAFDRLFKTIGDAESGPMKSFITWLIDVTDAVSDFLETDNQKDIREVADILDQIRETIGDSLTTTEDYTKKINELKQAQSASATSADVLKQRLQDVRDGLTAMSITEFEELQGQFKTAENTSEALTMAIALLEKQMKALNTETGKSTWDDWIIATEGAELVALRLSVRLQQAGEEALKGMTKNGETWMDELDRIMLEGEKEIAEADQHIIDENEKVVDAYKDQVDRIKAEMERLKDYMREDFYVDLGDYATGYFNSITAIQNNSTQRQINALERQKEYELLLAGDNTREQARIAEEYDEKLASLKEKQAQREQRAALFEIGVNTAVNAVKLFAQTIPPGILSAVAVGFGALQAGVVLSEPLPAFFKGVVGFKGKGTDKSDDNVVRISNNESVMTALSTRKFSRYLEAMNDPHFSEKDLHRMVLKQLPEGVTLREPQRDTHSEQAMTDEMKHMTAEIIGAIQEKEGVNITLDGHRYEASFRKGQNIKNHLAKKFGLNL